MVRLSSFAILSQSVEGDYRVLMNGCTGALDLIPSQLASLFEQIRDEAPHGMAYFQEELLHSETLDSLMEGGHITRLDHFQEKNLVEEIARGLHEKGRQIPHFMIVPNLDCNYRCTYCFERHLQIDIQSPEGILGRSPEKVVMSRDMVPLIYDCIEKIQSRAGREPGGMVILYGGEPLDGQHRDLIFELVQQGMERGYWFSVVTNGHDLDRFLPLVGGGGPEANPGVHRRTQTLPRPPAHLPGPRQLVRPHHVQRAPGADQGRGGDSYPGECGPGQCGAI